MKFISNKNNIHISLNATSQLDQQNGPLFQALELTELLIKGLNLYLLYLLPGLVH